MTKISCGSRTKKPPTPSRITMSSDLCWWWIEIGTHQAHHASKKKPPAWLAPLTLSFCFSLDVVFLPGPVCMLLSGGPGGRLSGAPAKTGKRWQTLTARAARSTVASLITGLARRISLPSGSASMHLWSRKRHGKARQQQQQQQQQHRRLNDTETPHCFRQQRAMEQFSRKAKSCKHVHACGARVSKRPLKKTSLS